MQFENLIKKISPTLKRITYRLNRRFAFFNEEDLYQEAMQHLWVDFRAGKLEDKTDSYILQGCYFYLKNYLRKLRLKDYFVSIDAALYEDGLAAAEILSLEDQNTRSYPELLSDQLLVETIMNNGLTSREKQLASLFMDGLTTRQIGLKLGVSHVAVVKSMRKIKEKCKKYLDG